MKFICILFFATLLSSNSCKTKTPVVDETKTEQKEIVDVTPIVKPIETTSKTEDAPTIKETIPAQKMNPIQEKAAKTLKDIVINYEATTRGFQMYTEIAKGKFMVKYGHSGTFEEVSISDENWNKIADLYSKIDLLTFEKLIGTTNEREYDGKAHGNLSITKNKKTYNTLGFDHTIPPAKIKIIVDLIVQLSAKKEE